MALVNYSLDEHTCVPDVVIINTLTWNSLSEFHQQVLMEAAEESVIFQRELWKSFVNESLDKMTAAGLQVYHPDKGPFKEKTEQLWREFDDTVIGALAKEIQTVQ